MGMIEMRLLQVGLYEGIEMQHELGAFEEEVAKKGEVMIEEMLVEVFVGEVGGGGGGELLLVVEQEFLDQLVATLVLCQQLFQFGEHGLVRIVLVERMVVDKDVPGGRGLDQQVRLGRGGGGAGELGGLLLLLLLLRDGTVSQRRVDHLEVRLRHVFRERRLPVPVVVWPMHIGVLDH